MLTLEGLVVSRGEFTLRIPKLEISGRNSFIFGKNGSGKSTLLMCIAGLQTHQGMIYRNGYDITNLPPEERNIALIPQDLALFPNMNVRKNVAISLRYGRGKEDLIEEVINELGINKILSRRIWELSQGEMQRVAVARALISAPSLILMDEPFSMQDEISRINSLSFIDDLSRRYRFDYIYVTHNPRDLDLGFSTLVTLDDGDLVEYSHSLKEIRHYRTLSLLDYSRIIQLNGNYYRIREENIRFDDSAGYDYQIFRSDGNSILKVWIDGRYAFIRYSGKVEGKKVIIDDTALEQIPY